MFVSDQRPYDQRDGKGDEGNDDVGCSAKERDRDDNTEPGQERDNPKVPPPDRGRLLRPSRLGPRFLLSPERGLVDLPRKSNCVCGEVTLLLGTWTPRVPTCEASYNAQAGELLPVCEGFERRVC